MFMRIYYEVGALVRHRQVEAFRSVMIAGSITEAANALHISQPSVRRLIGDLEASVGFKLFERKHGRIYPTAEAIQLSEGSSARSTGSTGWSATREA
jgi:DNA-binding transcriptional LysR family regulator